MGRAGQLTVETVAPGVIRAHDPMHTALPYQDRMRTVLANVIERSQHALFVANDCDRNARELSRGVGARGAHLFRMTYPLPGLLENLLLIDGEPSRVRIRLGAQGERARRIGVIARPDFTKLDLRWHRHGANPQTQTCKESIARHLAPGQAPELLERRALLSGLQQGHGALTAVGADADNRARARGSHRQLLHGLTENPRARRPERVTECNAAPVRVESLARERSESRLESDLSTQEFGSLEG